MDLNSLNFIYNNIYFYYMYWLQEYNMRSFCISHQQGCHQLGKSQGEKIFWILSIKVFRSTLFPLIGLSKKNYTVIYMPGWYEKWVFIIWWQPRFFSKKILWIFFKLFDLMWNTGTHLVNFIEFYYTLLLKLTVRNIISRKMIIS